jgi:adenine-specific DNA-methyltransferase
MTVAAKTAAFRYASFGTINTNERNRTMGLGRHAMTAKEAAQKQNQPLAQTQERPPAPSGNPNEAGEPVPANRILPGDCIQVMRHLPDACIDLVVTDPPYLTRYRDRSGRTVHNDDRNGWVRPAFGEIHRVLKPDAFCISFYGWNHVETFMSAWKEAGFRPVGHIVWRKNYASKTGFLQARHEQAYLLAKGYPPCPDCPLSDVRSWTYSGNKHHPTEKAVSVIEPLITAFSSPGDLVLDPFLGSGTTALAAQRCGRRYLGIEKDADYCAIAESRLAAANPQS